MPELPEVETVCRGMEQTLSNQVVSSVRVYRRDLRRIVSDDFESALIGRRLVRFLRRGKYIVMENDRGRFFILHLGMSGRVRLFSKTEALDLQKHDHVVIKTMDGVTAVYHDPRRFGFFDVLPEGADWKKVSPFLQMGAEPFDGWSAEDLLQKLKGKKTVIKQSLLDQLVVAGLGNIYVCEALWMSGVSPLRASCDIQKSEAQRLVASSLDILTRAIAAGGSTLKDYRQADGELGYFQYGFCVYGREGEKCKAQGCAQKILRIVQGGRSTFYCPACQK